MGSALVDGTIQIQTQMAGETSVQPGIPLVSSRDRDTLYYCHLLETIMYINVKPKLSIQSM